MKTSRKPYEFNLIIFGLLLALLFSLGMPGSMRTVQAAKPDGAYIVVFKKTIDPGVEAPAFAKAYGLETGFIYQHALKGMSVVVPEGRLKALEKDPRVAYVIKDMPRSIAAQTIPTGIERIFATSNVQLSIDGVDDLRVDVDVAVIDTGVDFEHPDLNVVGGMNCVGNPVRATCEEGGDDDHYHGTHVAGTIAAIDNDFGVVGVAPGARIWAVKVLNSRGSGYTSGIVAGIDWVAANADIIEVANMSLGGEGFNQAEYDAIQGAVDAGVAFAVAAGNSGDDVINYSPGSFDNVLTVSALADFDGLAGGNGSPTCFTDEDDTLAYFSNWGDAIDIAAPGACILSTFPLEQGEYGTISGTSMASPHAAGALALLASVAKPVNRTEVYNLYNQVINAGNFNWVDDSGDGVQEPLLDVMNSELFAPSMISGGGGGEENTAPTVTINDPQDNASYPSGSLISFSGSASDVEDGNLTDTIVWTSSKDGEIGTGGSFNAELSDGDHLITAAVTDSGGLAGSASVRVIVSASSSGINLEVTAYKVRGSQYADLAWSGATGDYIEVYRDGAQVTNTLNDGTYTDITGNKGGGSAIYQICEVGTSTCSSEVAVNW